MLRWLELFLLLLLLLLLLYACFNSLVLWLFFYFICFVWCTYTHNPSIYGMLANVNAWLSVWVKMWIKRLRTYNLFYHREEKSFSADNTSKNVFLKRAFVPFFKLLDAHVSQHALAGSYSLNVCDGWHKSCNGPGVQKQKRKLTCFSFTERSRIVSNTQTTNYY